MRRLSSYLGVEPDMPPDVLRAWRKAFRQARVYQHEWEGPVADLVVGEWYTKSGERKRMPKSVKMPPVGGLVWLGYLLEVHTAAPDGTIYVTKWRKMQSPDLLWSAKLRACVAYPRLKMPIPSIHPKSAPALAQLYRTWHAGKDPSGGSIVKLPQPTFTDILPAVATVYLSDKFDDDGVFREYIHHHEPGGVRAYLHRSAVMVRGGKLALTRHGLIH